MHVERVEGMTLELDVGAGEDGEGGKDVLVTSNATQKITEVSFTLQAKGAKRSAPGFGDSFFEFRVLCLNYNTHVGKHRIF